MPPTVLAGSASQALAARLAHELGGALARSQARRFPDGEASVRILDEVRGRDVVVVQSTAPDPNLVELLLWQDAAREAGARTVTAVVPYYAYARQDRLFAPGEALSARAVGRAIAAGCDRIITVDPHKEEVLAFLGGKGTSVTAVPQLAAELARWGVDVVLAPDRGARARAEAAARLVGCPVDHLEKTRISPNEVSMAPKNLEVGGARVAIVDDLIASGGTVLTAARQLKGQGAKAVYAACTHGLFAGDAAPRLLAGGVDRILATDTCPTPPGVHATSAAPALAGALRVVAA